MIRVTVKIGSGDRRLPDITDDLIISTTMGMVRARQALAASTYIIKEENLEMPHDPIGDVGRVSREFAYPNLEIYGQHYIKELTITLTGGSARDTVVAERYGLLLL